MISGSGNVSLFAAEKLLEYGAKVITLSDSNGTIYEVFNYTHTYILNHVYMKV